METLDFVTIIVQSGAVGIVVILVIYMWRRDKLNMRRDEMYNKTMNNHLQHTYESDLKMADVLEKGIEAVTELKGVIRGCKHNNLNKR